MNMKKIAYGNFASFAGCRLGLQNPQRGFFFMNMHFWDSKLWMSLVYISIVNNVRYILSKCVLSEDDMTTEQSSHR